MKQLARWISGSRLFGTDTPASDTDYAGIFQESLDNIILNRDAKHKKYTTGDDSTRNGADDIDSDEKELRTFINDAMAGQSYAIEGLFIPQDRLVSTSNEYEFLVKYRSKLIGNLKPIVSYCKSQAQVFSKKADNIEALDKAISAIENELHQLYKEGRNTNDYMLCELELYQDDYCKLEKGNESNMLGFYRVGSTQYQMNLKANKALEGIKGKRAKYGKRAEAATEYDGKAYSHAFRLAYEYKRLVQTNELILPLPERDFLKQVKLKEFSKEEVADKLEVLMDEVLALLDSVGKPDRDFWDEWLLWTYKNEL